LIVYDQITLTQNLTKIERLQKWLLLAQQDFATSPFPLTQMEGFFCCRTCLRGAAVIKMLLCALCYLYIYQGNSTVKIFS